MEISAPANKKEIDLLLSLLQNPNEDVKKSAAIDLENLSQRETFIEWHVDELINIIKDLNINISGQKTLDAGLHTAKYPAEPPTPSGQMLLLMETLYNITVYAVQSKNYAVIDKIREYTEILTNIAFGSSPYAKWYDRNLPQIRAVMILYYINDIKAKDALIKLLETDEFVQIPCVSQGVKYNSELVDACLLLSNKYRIEIKKKLYQLIGNSNKNIKVKAQLILRDLQKSQKDILQKIEDSSISVNHYNGVHSEIVIEVGLNIAGTGAKLVHKIPIHDVSYPKIKDDLAKITGKMKIVNIPSMLKEHIINYFKRQEY
jgi:HEAT repeat protein